MNQPLFPNVRLPLIELWRCSIDPEFLARMEELYTQLDAEIADHKPNCKNRGACCSFGEFGHALFVTSAELAYFLSKRTGPTRLPAADASCPYQENGLCTTRDERPSGCRVFFCESAGQGWQEGLAESFLKRVEQLHLDFDLPYIYIEWLSALDQLRGLTRPAPAP